MRYQNGETVRAAQVFQPGRTVTVEVINLATDAVMAVTTGVATESAQVSGLYIWPSSDIVTPPASYTEAAVVFTDTLSGIFKVTKIVFRGYVDNIDAAVSTRASQTSLDALNDLSITDVQTALTNQGYTVTRAAFLDNLDAAISSLNDLTQQQVRDAMKLAPTVGAPAAGSVDEHLDTLVSGVAGLNDLSIADVQTAMTNQGYTSGRAPNLDNLDATVSSRATQVSLDALQDISIADVQTALTNQGYTAARAILLDNLDQALSLTETNITAAIAALNDLSIADVQTGLTNQGYTVVRAALLDNLDQTLSGTQTAIVAAISALNNISVANILSASLTSGDTVNAALSRLDNIDTDVSGSGVTLSALDEFLRGGRAIDFVGSDSLGWQRVENDTAGSEVSRYNLFDEGGARITGTVTSFIAAQKMIASEVKI